MCNPWWRKSSTGNGALMTHLRGYRADAALIPEPENEKLARANVGVLWFQVEVRGRPTHVSVMGAGPTRSTRRTAWSARCGRWRLSGTRAKLDVRISRASRILST